MAAKLTDNKTLVGISSLVRSLDRSFLRDPQGTTCGCATCDLPLMDSPITRRCLVIPIRSEESHRLRDLLTIPVCRTHTVLTTSALHVTYCYKYHRTKPSSLRSAENDINGVFIVVHQHTPQKRLSRKKCGLILDLGSRFSP